MSGLGQPPAAPSTLQEPGVASVAVPACRCQAQPAIVVWKDAGVLAPRLAQGVVQVRDPIAFVPSGKYRVFDGKWVL
jgi:hypothetical protein